MMMVVVVATETYWNIVWFNDNILNSLYSVYLCEVGPCHHGMARPQVADGGTASDMEG